MDQSREQVLETEISRLKQDIEKLEEASKMLIRRDIDLRAAYDELKRFDKEKSDFVSTAAHQLRTPLTSVRFSYQMLKEILANKLDANQEKLLVVAEESIERMFVLIEGLITTDSLEYGKISLTLQSTNLELFATNILKQISDRAEAGQITIDTDFADTPVRVPIDVKYMSGVLLNILDNAIKYSTKGATIVVRTRYTNDSVTVAVADTGIGVHQEDVDKLFRKFSRADNARKVDANGSGLGLYIARRIIERHGGTLTYLPNKPIGSIFTVTLPLTTS